MNMPRRLHVILVVLLLVLRRLLPFILLSIPLALVVVVWNIWGVWLAMAIPMSLVAILAAWASRKGTR